MLVIAWVLGLHRTAQRAGRGGPPPRGGAVQAAAVPARSVARCRPMSCSEAAASELDALVPSRHMRIVRREPLRYELLVDRSHASAAAHGLQVADAA